MLPNRQDTDLSSADIQLLSSRDAITAFFAKLGYDTNQRLLQNVSAMGIGNDTLKTNIRHIERLASQDAGLFEVYLFELRSVTVANTQGIVRAFRDRPGDYLLVLTDDYSRLDFVLIERFNAQPGTLQEAAIPLPNASKQVSVRPRILTVQRRDPSEVALRVLRRFSYTESDTFAQYDKLTSAYDVADWSEPFFNNRALFSDYYLKERLPYEPIWDHPNHAASMTRAFHTLRTHYDDVRDTYNNQKLAVVHTKLIEPILATLGFTAHATKSTTRGSEIEPHYRLYATPSAPSLSPRTPARDVPTMDQHAAKGGNPSIVRTPLAGVLGAGGIAAAGMAVDANGQGGPLALCLAYTWNRNLDGKDSDRDSETPDENPGASVVTLLDRGEADWAIVTNGKIWRLYSAKAHSRATNYYEIDLEETLALPAANVQIAFRYFWLLFRAEAFIPMPPQTSQSEQRDLCFLDNLLSESERYARILGERLRGRVFDEIFPHFARGFIRHARQTGQIAANLESLPDEERNHLLEPYFSGTLTFLYRLLFLLYAESRDLLPVREVRGYYMKSLERIKQQIAAHAGKIEDEAPTRIEAAYHDLSTRIYDELQTLFSALDKGDSDLNVPLYNGGLFVTQPDPNDPAPEAEVARFLATHKIPDRELALGLDRMARDIDEKRQDLAFIDYKSLGVRQLGSIYEGLLEFKLRVAPVEMAVVKGKKTEEIVPYAEATQKKLPIVKDGRGQYATDRTYPRGKVYLENDRRERKATGSYYTPDYIVKYIVEHTVGPVLSEKLEALRPIFREAEQFLRTQKDKEKALQKQRILTKGDTPENETYKHYKDRLNLAFFDLKVLDPAMGSGHFLVEAVDYITDQMAKFLTSFKWNPIVHELSETRRDIQQEMERQGVTVDMSKLTDINLLKRQVLKRCIYGVDLNPMAVELAKVSLWLDCFTLGAPLSFLDHHMKYGNSLIGGNVQEVQEALSTNLWTNQFTYLLSATELMRRVGSFSDITAQEVAESRKAYQGAYDALAPFKRLLDVWLSEYFGNKAAKHTTRLYAGAIVASGYSKVSPKEKEAITTALDLARSKRFFHWELEFPEVFYDAAERKENGGFDAVVGNPPYDELSEDERGSKIDELPYLQASLQLQPALGYRINLYRLFIAQGLNIVRSGGWQSFIIPMSLLADRFTFSLRKHLLETTHLRLIELFPQKDDPRDRVFLDAKLSTCLYVIQKVPCDHRSLVYVRTHPGRLIQVNSPNYTSLQSDFFRFDLDNLSIPGLSQQAWNIVLKLATSSKLSGLAKVAKALPGELMINRQFDPYLAKATDGEEIIRGSHIGMYEIVEPKQGEPLYLNRNKYISHHADSIKASHYLRERVVYQRYAAIDNFRRLIATILPPDYFCSHTVGYLAEIKNCKLSFFVALLNSVLLDWRFNLTSTNNNINGYEVESLPIPSISFTTPPQERARLLEKAKNLYAYCITKDEPTCVTGFVEHHLGMEPEQSDVVHDLLAFLAEEMIRLNKEKRAITKTFLDWLVQKLRIVPDKDGRKGIEVLTGKSKLSDYPGDYQKAEPPLAFDELLEILQKNKGKLGVKLSNDGFVDQLRMKYEESLGKVLPLKGQLEKTDRLIDLVVYRLYGLTEEEVAVVEGKE